MGDCIFCKIIKKDIPNYTVFADDSNLAFLDIMPRSLGHTVVIPKEHALTIFDLKDDESEKLMITVKKAMLKLQDVLKPDGFSVGWNHGEAGGQAVPHLHVHIFPRWDNDGGGNQHTIINNPGAISVAELAKKF